MGYEYFRFAPFVDKERKRQLINDVVLKRLSTGSDNPISLITQPGFLQVGRLTGFFRHPEKSNRQTEMIRWLLRYGKPALVGKLIKMIQDGRVDYRHARMIADVNIDNILSEEYLQPDIQIVSIKNEPENTLVCFSGNALQPNLEMQLFHLLAAGSFDRIIYLRDHKRQCFTEGISPIAEDISELTKWLQTRIPEDAKVSVIGTSSGGLAAIQFAEAIKAFRVMLFSPPYEFKGSTGGGSHGSLSTDSVRLYFGDDNSRDQYFYEQWKAHYYAPAIRLLNSDSHGTLGYLTEHGYFGDIIAWLSGSSESGLPGKTATVD